MGGRYGQLRKVRQLYLCVSTGLGSPLGETWS